MNNFEKEASLIAVVTSLIATSEGVVEEQRTKLKRYRSEGTKRAAKRSIDFFGAITYHLRRLQAMDLERVNNQIKCNENGK